MIKRYSGNPILTKKDVPYPVATVHNAGMVKHNDGYIMLFRSHNLNGRSIIGKAISSDGYNFKVDPTPFITPATEGVFKEYGSPEALRDKYKQNTIHVTYQDGKRETIERIEENKDRLASLIVDPNVLSLNSDYPTLGEVFIKVTGRELV